MSNHKPFSMTGAAWMLALAFIPATQALAQNAAVVNGQPVPKARVDALAQQIERSGRPVTPEMQSQIRDEVIAREIFMQEAKKRGLDKTDNFRDQLELARQTILIRDLFADQQKKAPATDAELKAEYDKVAAANAGKQYKASHILYKEEDQAKAAIAAIKGGAKFEDIAKKESIDTGSGAEGGAMEFAAPGSYVKEFSEGMTALKKGEMTETPVKSQFGYHVIRLDDVRDAEFPKFEEVKGEIAKQMEQKKLADFQQELRAKAKVE